MRRASDWPRPGRLCLSALLGLAMAGALAFPGGTAALAEALPEGEVLELGADAPGLEGQGEEKGKDEPLELGEPEKTGGEALELGEPEPEGEGAPAVQDEEPALATQEGEQNAVASVTANGATTSYESFEDALDAWVAADGDPHAACGRVWRACTRRRWLQDARPQRAWLAVRGH